MKQKNIGQHWGRFSLASSQIGIVVSTVTLLTVLIPAYNPVKSWLSGFGINFPFWGFALVVATPIVVAYFIAWKYLVVSFYNSSTQQFWSQSKEIVDKIDKLQKTLDELKNK